jgi:hypothetical protein
MLKGGGHGGAPSSFPSTTTRSAATRHAMLLQLKRSAALLADGLVFEVPPASDFRF